MIPTAVLQLLIILVPAVILHECAHGWVADKLGDSTARLMGRLTLNPIKHIDPLGTIIVPALLWYSGLPILGWAKPVPVNFAGLNNPKRDMIWVGLAGPAVNIILAIIFSLLLRLDVPPVFEDLAVSGVFINLLLATFNMIPIPPLDGSRLVMGILPDDLAHSYARLETWGILIVFAFLYAGLLNKIIWPIVIVLAKYLGVSLE